MAQVAFHNSYKLKKGVSTAEFVRVVEQLNREYISKQRGYLSFELFLDGETWAARQMPLHKSFIRSSI